MAPFICQNVLALGWTSQCLLRCPAPEEINHLGTAKASPFPGNSCFSVFQPPERMSQTGVVGDPGIFWGWGQGKARQASFSDLGRLANWPPFYRIGQCRGGVLGSVHAKQLSWIMSPFSQFLPASSHFSFLLLPRVGHHPALSSTTELCLPPRYLTFPHYLIFYPVSLHQILIPSACQLGYTLMVDKRSDWEPF